MSHIESTNKELLELRALFKSINFLTSNHSTHLLIQNTCNGPVIATSHSLELSRHYTTDNPLVRLLLSAVQNHRNHLKDGGSFLGVLVCEMVTKFYRSHYQPRMYIQVLSWCSKQASVIMEELAVNKLKVSVDSIASVLYSITNSKLSSYLSQPDINSLVKHLANVFIMSGGVTHRHTLAYLKGIDTALTMALHPAMAIDNHHAPLTLPPGKYSTALISCSMSGDTEEVIDGTYLGKSSQHISKALLDRLEGMVTGCAERGVSLIICQRVIHPSIKLKLESLNIRYLERLGLAIHRIAYMTGLVACQSVTDTQWPTETRETLVEHCTHNGEVHLLLTCSAVDSKPVFTLQICSWSEHITRDVEAACVQALEVLQVLLTDMRLLPGRCHWQRLVSQRLKHLASCVTSDEVTELGCTVSCLRNITEHFTTALHAESLIGSSDDGEPIEDSIDIQDCFVSYNIALNSAVSIAKVIILTGRVIKEA